MQFVGWDWSWIFPDLMLSRLTVFLHKFTGTPGFLRVKYINMTKFLQKNLCINVVNITAKNIMKIKVAMNKLPANILCFNLFSIALTCMCISFMVIVYLFQVSFTKVFLITTFFFKYIFLLSIANEQREYRVL